MGLLNKLFGAGQSANDNRYDYGNLSKPPSAAAGAILAAMTEKEKLNFRDLLRHLRQWHEPVPEKGLTGDQSVLASLWGAALSKIADQYRDVGRNDKALFFTSAAWKISRYPIFAYNLAVLAERAAEEKHAKTLLETYLAEYRKVQTNPVLKFVNPEITEDELEDIAKSARERLAVIQSHSRDC